MDAAEREALAADLARPVSYLSGLVSGMGKIDGAHGDGWQHLTGCFAGAAEELGAIFEAALDGQGAYTRVLNPGSPEKRTARQAGPETPRIRWYEAEDRIVAFSGAVGPKQSVLFRILRPSPGYPDWALTTDFPGQSGKARYADDGPDAVKELKTEAERWLEEYVSSLGASFEPSTPDAAIVAAARAFAQTWFELLPGLPDSYGCEMCCAEADAAAALYRALGDEATAAAIMAAHAEHDVEGDAHWAGEVRSEDEPL